METQGLQIIRPIALTDLDALRECAEEASHGIYSLPKDRQRLKNKILKSTESFSKKVKVPENEVYLFVLEDVQSGKVIGTSDIVSKIGTAIPFYAFKIEKIKQTSPSVNIEREHKILKLQTVRRGPTEIGGLFLSPAYRRAGLGRLLSLSRFLFMAAHPHRFHDTIVAEMRGVIREDGFSPFWEHLGRHFFSMDFPTATLLRSIEQDFIGDLAPQFPIYVDFLPLEAREVIGRTHENTLPALHMLQQEGFSYHDDVDIFDGGPDLYASLNAIRTVKESVLGEVSDISQEPLDSSSYIVGTAHLDYRGCIAPLLIGEAGGITLHSFIAEALKIKKGDFLRYIPLHHH